MNFLYAILFVGGIIATLFFGFRADKSLIKSQKRRNYIIVTIISLVIVIVAIVLMAMN